jgi:hypothetical protein
MLSMHLSSRDHGRPAAGRAFAIACQQQARGTEARYRNARNAAACYVVRRLGFS